MLAQLANLERRTIERFLDLRLQPRLLVPADLEIREVERLRPHIRSRLEERAVVAPEGLAQEALALGRIAFAQLPAEVVHARRIKSDVAATRRHEPCELESDLLEHLPVAARHGIARAFERIERALHRSHEAAKLRLRIEQPSPQQAAPQRLHRSRHPHRHMQALPQHRQEIFTPDRLSRLTRRPRGERAPVRGAAAARGDRKCELVIRQRDPQIADDRVLHRRDLAHVVHGRRPWKRRHGIAGGHGDRLLQVGHASRRRNARDGSFVSVSRTRQSGCNQSDAISRTRSVVT